MKYTKKTLDTIRETWYNTWVDSNRKTMFPRDTSIALRAIGYTARQVLGIVNDISAKEPSTVSKPEIDFLNFYNDLFFEIEENIIEDTTETPQGQIFILKAKHGLQDKNIIKVETDLNIQDIIRENSPHNDKRE